MLLYTACVFEPPRYEARGRWIQKLLHSSSLQTQLIYSLRIFFSTTSHYGHITINESEMEYISISDCHSCIFSLLLYTTFFSLCDWHTFFFHLYLTHFFPSFSCKIHKRHVPSQWYLSRNLLTFVYYVKWTKSMLKELNVLMYQFPFLLLNQVWFFEYDTLFIFTVKSNLFCSKLKQFFFYILICFTKYPS